MAGSTHEATEGAEHERGGGAVLQEPSGRHGRGRLDARVESGEPHDRPRRAFKGRPRAGVATWPALAAPPRTASDAIRTPDWRRIGPGREGEAERHASSNEAPVLVLLGDVASRRLSPAGPAG